MLTRWDPFRDMMVMRRTMDRMIDNSINEEQGTPSDWGLPLDVIEDENEYTVKASVAGIKPDDLDITYNKGVLTIRGEIKDDRETNKGQYHLRERRYGTFSRSLALPTSISADSIQASYNDGILTLKLPKAEEVKPKRIAINGAGNGQKVIEPKK